MKKSTLSENIASEIPYLISLEELLKDNLDDGVLVLSHIVNAIPEIIPPSAVLDYNLYNIFEKREQASSNIPHLLHFFEFLI